MHKIAIELLFIPYYTNSFCHFNDTIYVIDSVHSDLFAFHLKFKIWY